MIGIAYGEAVKKVWLVFIVGANGGACVGFATIFASSLAAVVPTIVYPTCDIYQSETFFSDCRFVYWFWLALFYIAMMWYCIRGLAEQAWMQILMATIRYIVILTLMITSALEIAGVTDNWDDKFDVGEIPTSINLAALGIIMPMVSFAI